jgi:hypothetical protein
VVSKNPMHSFTCVSVAMKNRMFARHSCRCGPISKSSARMRGPVAGGTSGSCSTCSRDSGRRASTTRLSYGRTGVSTSHSSGVQRALDVSARRMPRPIADGKCFVRRLDRAVEILGRAQESRPYSENCTSTFAAASGREAAAKAAMKSVPLKRWLTIGSTSMSPEASMASTSGNSAG